MIVNAHKAAMAVSLKNLRQTTKKGSSHILSTDAAPPEEALSHGGTTASPVIVTNATT